jgi:hypothetical protein
MNVTLSDLADGLSVVSFFLSIYAVREVNSIRKTKVQSNIGYGNVNATGGYVGRDRNDGTKPNNG